MRPVHAAVDERGRLRAAAALTAFSAFGIGAADRVDREVAEFAIEEAVIGAAAEFAVGDEFEAELLLQRDGAADGLVLGRGQRRLDRSRRERSGRVPPSAPPGAAGCRYVRRGTAAWRAASMPPHWRGRSWREVSLFVALVAVTLDAICVVSQRPRQHRRNAGLARLLYRRGSCPSLPVESGLRPASRGASPSAGAPSGRSFCI